MAKIAIVTGASSGLGRQFVRAVVERYSHVDEVWIMARRKELLQEIAAGYPNRRIKPIAMDLTKESAYSDFGKLLEAEKPDVRLLVSNAGLAKHGLFDSLTVDDILSMDKLNVCAVSVLSRICLDYMGKGSCMVITSSTSSFVPNVNQAVYSSTKAFATSFGRAIREEWKPRGIKVCVLCPGNMDTEMNSRKEEMEKKSPLSHYPYLDTYKVAVNTLRKAENGVGIYTPGWFYKMYRVVSKIVPESIMIRIAKL